MDVPGDHSNHIGAVLDGMIDPRPVQQVVIGLDPQGHPLAAEDSCVVNGRMTENEDFPIRFQCVLLQPLRLLVGRLQPPAEGFLLLRIRKICLVAGV